MAHEFRISLPTSEANISVPLPRLIGVSGEITGQGKYLHPRLDPDWTDQIVLLYEKHGFDYVWMAWLFYSAAVRFIRGCYSDE